MAISEFEIRKCEKELEGFLAKRCPPPHVRKQLDFGYSIQGQSIELLEICPNWQNPSDILKRPFAKATYVKTKKRWKIYWQSADLSWHSYEPEPNVRHFSEFLNVVAEDRFSCFFG